MNIKKYKVIGLMSGTSLDGLDIALCEFEKLENWTFKIIKAETISYTEEWQNKLKNAPYLSGFDLLNLHKDYGNFLGEKVNIFLKNEAKKDINFISSHGHTIFHVPENNFTFQLGNGANICATSELNTISDFRSLDIALGGQGAPLVPIGDKLLFNQYDFCINLGGFANISFEKNNERIAFDICPVNIAINFFMQKIGQTFDKNGNFAKQGKVNNHLLKELNDLDFYKKEKGKSLSREWLEKSFLSIIEAKILKISDILRTIYEHIVFQIEKITSNQKNKKILLTGGGSHNKFLVQLLKAKLNHEIIIPNLQIIDFKEALIFAFLGVLRFRNEINSLKSVSNALKNNIGGSIFKN